jgi:glyoxylase-like metal-dependent hydrolase (beta-lactamase superfamily II)
MLNEGLPLSKHFQLVKLSEKIFAALHKEGGLGICNTGIIDLGEQTLVVDATYTPVAAQELKTTAEMLTARPVSLVINTHHHKDHILGNQAFKPRADIISSQRTCDLIKENTKDELQQLKYDSKERILLLKEDLKNERDPKKIAEMSETIYFLMDLSAILPNINPTPPNITFEEKISLYGTKRQAECITFKLAHSPGDTVVFLPEEKILFCGDLLFAHKHPYMGSADIKGWIAALKTIMALEPEVIVPGHGYLAKIEDLQRMKEYLQFIEQAVSEVFSKGEGKESLDNISVPDQFSTWEQPERFHENLGLVYQKMKYPRLSTGA